MASLAPLFLALVSLQLTSQVWCSWEGEWDPDELDIFDLVEEIGENFYDIMQVDQTATQSEIRRAYRKLSLQLHPDKSDDPNAAQKFQKMVTVYDVLKDEVKRSIYDEVLEVGLPDWRQPVFYYRKVRKMGFLEISLILLGITSVGHYLYGWANYVEQKLVVHDLLQRKKKKEQRKMRQIKALHAKQVLEAELEMKNAQAQASKPKLKNLLPILIIRHLILLLLAVCAYIYNKFIKKTPSSDITAKPAKKTASSKKESSKSTSAKRKNGRVRAKHPESESSEGELEKREELSDGTVKISSDSNKKSESLESVDESEDDVCSHATATELTLSPDKNGGRKKSDEDGARKNADEKVPKNKDKDFKEDKKSVSVGHTMKEFKKKEDAKATMVVKGDSKSGKCLAGREGRESRKVEDPNKEADMKLKESKMDGSREQDSNQKEDSSKLGASNKEITAGGVDGRGTSDKSREADKLEKRKQGSDDKDLKPTDDGGSGESSSDGHLAGGWQMASSGRSKAQKKKVAVEQKANQEQSKNVRTTVSPPSLGSQKESSASQNGTWTQLQQDMLEWGLSNYPKSSEDRWLNISKAVPGKSVEDCKLRCIHLYEELKQKKSS